MLLRLSSDYRRAMDLSLVLDQEGIPHELRRVGEARWGLQIDEKDAARAETAAAAFERENPPEVRRPEVVHPITGAVASGVAFPLAFLAMYVRTAGADLLAPPRVPSPEPTGTALATPPNGAGRPSAFDPAAAPRTGRHSGP